MKKVIFIYPKKASFIKLDINILSRKYTVIQNTYNWENKFLLPFFLFKQFFFLLFNTKKTSYLIVSFGGYWSVLPVLMGRIFRKPVFIILHGTDCAAFHEINYGNMRKFLMRKALKFSYRFATKLLPVSDSLVYNENTFFSESAIIKQGYKHFFKKNTTDFAVIHNGIDTEKWHIDTSIERKKNRFTTVLSEGQFVLKGGDLILEAAKKLPQCEFYFIGLEQPKSISNLSVNIQFIPRQTPEQLLKYYNSSQYYLQLSLIEGFGCALAEAMSCGCIPIVSSVNILPDIIGESGYVLSIRNASKLIQLIESIDGNKNGELARKRIIENYTVEKRQNLLYQTLESTNK